MTDEVRFNKIENVVASIAKYQEEQAKINSKMNGEYLKMDKEASEYRISFSKDLNYIKEGLEEVKALLKAVTEGYVKREEFEARFTRLQEEVDGRFKGVHDRVNAKLDTDRFDEHANSINEKLASLIDNQKWVTRIIIGSVILALLSLVIINTQ